MRPTAPQAFAWLTPLKHSRLPLPPQAAARCRPPAVVPPVAAPPTVAAPAPRESDDLPPPIDDDPPFLQPELRPAAVCGSRQLLPQRRNPPRKAEPLKQAGHGSCLVFGRPAVLSDLEENDAMLISFLRSTPRLLRWAACAV